MRPLGCPPTAASQRHGAEAAWPRACGVLPRGRVWRAIPHLPPWLARPPGPTRGGRAPPAAGRSGLIPHAPARTSHSPSLQRERMAELPRQAYLRTPPPRTAATGHGRAAMAPLGIRPAVMVYDSLRRQGGPPRSPCLPQRRRALPKSQPRPQKSPSPPPSACPQSARLLAVQSVWTWPVPGGESGPPGRRQRRGDPLGIVAAAAVVGGGCARLWFLAGQTPH